MNLSGFGSQQHSHREVVHSVPPTFSLLLNKSIITCPVGITTICILAQVHPPVSMIWTEGSITLARKKDSLLMKQNLYSEYHKKERALWHIQKMRGKIQDIFQPIKRWWRTYSAVRIKKQEVWITWQWEAVLSLRILEVSARGAQAKPKINQREWLTLLGSDREMLTVLVTLKCFWIVQEHCL